MDTGRALIEQNEFSKAIRPGPVLPSALEVHEEELALPAWSPPISHQDAPSLPPMWAAPGAKLGKPTGHVPGE